MKLTHTGFPYDYEEESVRFLGHRTAPKVKRKLKRALRRARRREAARVIAER